MRICLCDDESAQLDLLSFLIDKWQRQSYEQCDVVIYHSAEEMLFETAESYPYDLMVLDIQMGQMNGIALAKKIRESDKKVMIAFLSALSDYVFDGYEVNAIRYLLKPLKEEQLFQILDTVKEMIKTEKKYLIVNVDREKVKIEYEDIVYIEAFSHYVTFYTQKGNYDTKKGINMLGTELAPFGFEFVHRSYLVHLKYIERIAKIECILTNGIKVPISKNYYKKLNDAFIKYYRKDEF